MDVEHMGMSMLGDHVPNLLSVDHRNDPWDLPRDKVTDADTFVRHTSALAEPPPVRDA